MSHLAKSIPWILLALISVGVIWRMEINGWGSLAWLAGTIGMVAIRAPFAAKTSQNKVTLSKRDRIEQISLVGMTLSMMLLPVIHLLTGFLCFADYRMPGWLTALGALGLLPALYLIWRSHADLGRNWSVTLELRDGHSLVSNGIYGHIRHPMYAGIWLLVLVQPLLLHNWLAGPVAILCFGALYLIRAPREEAMMQEQFGAEYEAYMQRTHRLIPGLF